MRAFIAIDLDPSLKDALLALVEGLKRKKGEIRWANPSGMHLTLKFLGEVGPDEASEVSKALDLVVPPHRAFPLVLEGTGQFPSGRRPRVLWAGIRPQSELQALQADIDRELESRGFPRDDRPFHPHLTLGRIKGPSFVRETLAELEKDRDRLFGEMRVLRVTLFESLLGPQGARYQAISEHPLS